MINENTSKFESVIANILRVLIFPIDVPLLLLLPVSLIGLLLSFTLPVYLLFIHFGVSSIIFTFLFILLYFLFKTIIKLKLSKLMLCFLILGILGIMGNLTVIQRIIGEDNYLSGLSFLSYLLGIVYAKLNYELSNFIKNKKYRCILSALLGMSTSGFLLFCIIVSTWY